MTTDYLTNSFFVGGVSFTKALSRSASGDLRFQATSLAGFQIERVLLGVGDDSFAGYLTFEAADCAFDAFIIVNLYLCHSKTSEFVLRPKSLHNARHTCQSGLKRL
jgi:hypothetical protein